jgi:hypothetical protein
LCTLEITTKTPATEAATKLYIHNVYNPPRSSDCRTSCLPHLRTALSAHQEEEQIILGDFNLHHELWGGLTVRERDPESDDLIDIMEEYQLGSLLPADTVTYDDKNGQSCIDLCYGTQDLVDRVVKCGVDYEMDHNSDHLPIITILDLRTIQRQQAETRDWSSTMRSVGSTSVLHWLHAIAQCNNSFLILVCSTILNYIYHLCALEVVASVWRVTGTFFQKTISAGQIISALLIRL